MRFATLDLRRQLRAHANNRNQICRKLAISAVANKPRQAQTLAGLKHVCSLAELSMYKS